MTDAFTPLAVHESATPDPSEVLVSGTDADGLPRNVLLRDATALRAELLATPATIVNPNRVDVEARAFTAALKQVATEEAKVAASESAVASADVAERVA